MELIDKPGVYDLTDSQYHADPCIRPSLSSSGANVLAFQSALHFATGHPRIPVEGMPSDNPTSAMLMGTALHRLILQGDDSIWPIDADSFRTKAAREERDEALKEGYIPMLTDEYIRTKIVSDKHRQCFNNPDLVNEQTFVAITDDDAFVRAKVDSYEPFRNDIIDLKTTSKSVGEWVRTSVWSYLMQAGIYRFAVQSAMKLEEKPEFFFYVLETFPPYESRVIRLDDVSLKFADRIAAKVIQDFSDLMVSEKYYGYPKWSLTLTPPAWVIDKAYRELNIDMGEE